jgi:ectoine hydroxylase-related dioxygenase (phytanoyl-CoA dioxygenase family)
MANLLQVSSAFGRAMETVDRARVVEAVHRALVAARAAGMPRREVANVVAASAEGYAFPTNLDRDQPVDGMSPRTQAELVTEALATDVPLAELRDGLSRQQSGRKSH